VTTTAVPSASAVGPSTVEDVAYREGLAAGLRAILDPLAPVPVTPEGYTLLPAGCPALFERPGLTVLPHALAATEGLVLVRLEAWARGATGPDGALRPRACGGGAQPPRACGGGARYALPLVAVRMGLLRRMLDAAVAHLAGRQSDGAPLTARQLVQAAVADAATTLETCGHALSSAARAPLRQAARPSSAAWAPLRQAARPSSAAWAPLRQTAQLGTAGASTADPESTVDGAAAAGWLHARLDRADLTVATMFGAAGYLRGHPVRCLHVAALVREAWAPGASTDHGWES